MFAGLENLDQVTASLPSSRYIASYADSLSSLNEERTKENINKRAMESSRRVTRKIIAVHPTETSGTKGDAKVIRIS